MNSFHSTFLKQALRDSKDVSIDFSP